MDVRTVAEEHAAGQEVVAQHDVRSAVMEYLEAVFLGVGEALVDVLRRTNTPGEPGLIFPKYRDGTLRACEQEAKVLFVQQLLSDQRYRLAVETPTAESYQFDGTSGTRSAQVDVSLFFSGHEIGAHVEFKADNCKLKYIRKDLAKLIGERNIGGWFHTLGAADRRTLPVLARKFQRSFADLHQTLEQGEPHACLFAFCVIRQQLLFLRWVRLGGKNALADCASAFDDLSLTSSSWTSMSWRADQQQRQPSRREHLTTRRLSPSVRVALARTPSRVGGYRGDQNAAQAIRTRRGRLAGNSAMTRARIC